MWTTQHIIDDNIKKAQLVIALQDHVLTWYIKYCSNNTIASLADTKDALNNEFSKSKFESQLVV